MTGFRNKKRTNPFVQIDKNMLGDKNVSWKAKGILAYLLSKPDGWITYAVDIENNAKDGRDSVASGIRELITAGYLERKQLREGGQFKGYEYSVYEYPISVKNTVNGFPVNGKSDNGETVNGKTDNGKPTTSNNDLSNNDLSNNDLSNNNYNDNNAPKTEEVENEKTRENPFSFFEQNGFGALGKHIGDKIGLWIDDLSEELVMQAMKIAVENGAINWNYVETILRDWSNKKLKTLADYEAHELKREQEKSSKANNVRKRSYGAPAKTEVVPEWFGKSQSSMPKEQTEGSTEDMAERRRKLQEELKGMSKVGAQSTKNMQ